jgi:hypothetical protein
MVPWRSANAHKCPGVRNVEEMVYELTSGDMGLFTGPHQTSLSDPGSFTTRLSRGDRPVLAPEYADKAPVEVIAVPGS